MGRGIGDGVRPKELDGAGEPLGFATARLPAGRWQTMRPVPASENLVAPRNGETVVFATLKDDRLAEFVYTLSVPAIRRRGAHAKLCSIRRKSWSNPSALRQQLDVKDSQSIVLLATQPTDIKASSFEDALAAFAPRMIAVGQQGDDICYQELREDRPAVCCDDHAPALIADLVTGRTTPIDQKVLARLKHKDEALFMKEVSALIDGALRDPAERSQYVAQLRQKRLGAAQLAQLMAGHLTSTEVPRIKAQKKFINYLLSLV